MSATGTYLDKPSWKSWKAFDHPTWRTSTQWYQADRRVRPDAQPRGYVWQAHNTKYVAIYSILDTTPIKKRKIKTLPLPGTPMGEVAFMAAPLSRQLMMPVFQQLKVADNGALYARLTYGMTPTWRADFNKLRVSVFLQGDGSGAFWGKRKPMWERGGTLYSAEFDLKAEGLTVREVYEIAMQQYRRCLRVLELVA